ncbi:ABC transporter family substrate-binding protein [Paramicrobacterium humi]|uniref:ABC transporter family substrate-binding protein n=1 Tax=Paramicrobacterium humi TaxID=640635 RepID=UPI0015A12BC3|nr:ABC transporter family substrate-binding protein [Microbacterium humi]
MTIGWGDRFNSYNVSTSYGAASINGNITSLTLSGFTAYDNTLELRDDTSFGSVEKISDDPLVVRYSLADTATWSDGTPVDAADLLLDWAANSRARDTPSFDPGDYLQHVADTGSATLPDDTVYFDSGASPEIGLGLVDELPQISDDGRSMTVTYSAPNEDWQQALPPPLPAHVIARNSLGTDDPDAGKHAVIDAITEPDSTALSKIASFWNTGFNYTSLPDDEGLYLSSGPYVIDRLDPDTGVTLRANPEYRGKHAPSIETIDVRYIPDPTDAVTALADGEVDVISPQATAAVANVIADVEDVKILIGYVASFEHLDLQFGTSKNGVFDDPRVREAFLKVVPRQQIVDELIRPIVGKDASVRDSFVFIPGTEGYAASVKASAAGDFDAVDVDGAQKLLAEAGVPNPEVCILYASNNPRRAQEFALIKASAEQAGFTVTDCGTEQWREILGVPGKYDASLFAWESSSLAAVDSASRYMTGARNNLNGYSSDKVDGLYRTLSATSDAATSDHLLADVDAALWADAYGAPLYQFPSITAYNPATVRGVEPSILSPTVFWNVWDWTIP